MKKDCILAYKIELVYVREEDVRMFGLPKEQTHPWKPTYRPSTTWALAKKIDDNNIYGTKIRVMVTPTEIKPTRLTRLEQVKRKLTQVFGKSHRKLK